MQRAADTRLPDERFCVLFLGSNIGNFDPPGAADFLTTIRRAIATGDSLLIGADLVKPERELLLAYDDPLGVTAAFNRNLLVRINRELGATFDVNAFSHRAVWNRDASRIEMHLVSEKTQRADIPSAGLSLDFAPGETIWTESSYKYDTDTFDAMLSTASFATTKRWVDTEGRFLLTVARAVVNVSPTCEVRSAKSEVRSPGSKCEVLVRSPNGCAVWLDFAIPAALRTLD